MRKQEFYERIKQLTGEILGENYTIILCHQSKIGFGILDAMIIRKAEEKVAPVIYLQEYYEQFLVGEDISSLILAIMERYYKTLEEQKQVLEDSSFLEQKELIEQKLFFYCIQTEKNQEMLKEIPHKEVLDLSLICGILVSQKRTSIASITVTEKMMETYGWTEETLFQKASDNTPLLFPKTIQSMMETLTELSNGMQDPMDIQKELQAIEKDSFHMIMISNSAYLYGFSVIFYPNVLQELAEKSNKNLIIVPSSIHEALILADDEILETKKINQMITEINHELVREEERLSDHAYYYDRKRKEVFFLSDYKKGVYDLCARF